MSSTTAIAPSATPVLDRQKPMPPAPRGWIGLFLGIPLGILVGVGLQQPGTFLPAFVSRALQQTSVPLALVWLMVAQYLVVIVHEFGHFLFGTAAGLKLNFLRIGPFQISQSWKVSLHGRKGTGAAGMTSLIPPENPLPRSHLVIYVLGGITANVLTATAVILLDRWRPLPTFFGMFVFVSLLIAGINLIPFRYRTMVTDGGRIWMLFFKPRHAERWLTLLRLFADLARGVKPENLDSEAIAVATRLRDKSPDTVGAHSVAYMAAYHRHRDDEAAQALEVCLAHANFVAPASRQSLSCSAGLFLARRRGNIETARQWLNSLPKKTIIPSLREQIEAAILEAEGNTAGAVEKLNQSLQLVARMPDDVDRRLRIASLEKWKGELAPKSAGAS